MARDHTTAPVEEFHGVERPSTPKPSQEGPPDDRPDRPDGRPRRLSVTARPPARLDGVRRRDPDRGRR